MRTFISSLALLVLAGAGIVYGQKVGKEGAEWLSRYSEAASTNITGEYTDKHWGKVSLSQAKGAREVTGRGDGWDITGVVSGKKVYLLFADKGRINYSAELDIEGQILVGNYASGMMTPKSKTRSIRLVR